MNPHVTHLETAEAILSSRSPVDHPIITQCLCSSPGMPSFAEGSPYLIPENVELFLKSLRTDVSLMSIEPAHQVFRELNPAEEYPIPEACTPYLDANSLGFYLRPLLPMVFVRTRRAELLLEARVAMKYLRENSRQFAKELQKIQEYAQTIFQPEALEVLRASHPLLFSDVVQPYSSFTSRHFSMRAGLWVHTPPGISTVIGPPLNQQTIPLKVVTGSIETDWHHFELFVVFEAPEFENQVLVIEPKTVVAQLYFVARDAQERTELRFSRTDPGAEPVYWAGWDALGRLLLQEGKGRTADLRGVASVQIACPHCFFSVTAASENGVPEGHVMHRGFNPAYKILKHAYRRLRDIRSAEGQSSHAKRTKA
jgi:hypothetical protein